MKNRKLLYTTLILLLVITVIGATYAWYTWTSEKINSSGNSGCFTILYDKGEDIGSDQNKATLMPSDDYTGGLSATVKMNISSSCTTSGRGKIYLETLNTTSSNLYRAGLLNYQILKNGTVTDIKGSISESGKIEIDVGELTKASTATDRFTVYVWIDNNLVENTDAYSVYRGKISAEAEQRD